MIKTKKKQRKAIQNITEPFLTELYLYLDSFDFIIHTQVCSILLHDSLRTGVRESFPILTETLAAHHHRTRRRRNGDRRPTNRIRQRRLISVVVFSTKSPYLTDRADTFRWRSGPRMNWSGRTEIRGVDMFQDKARIINLEWVLKLK